MLDTDPRRRAPSRSVSALAVWVLHMVLPVLGLWLLVGQSRFDVVWEHHETHFWIVVTAAGLNVLLAFAVSEQARRRADARLSLVSLAFLTSAGFLGLHALATPGVLLGGKNVGFDLATPIGLVLAGAIALVSSIAFSPAAAARVVRRQPAARLGLALVLVAWGVVSLAALPPLDRALTPEDAHDWLLWLTLVGTVLYGVAALRYYLLLRQRPAAVLLSVITAFVLLAEALVAIYYARNWHGSWWEWHLLMVMAFGFVAYSARVQYRREGSRTGLFNGIALEQTLADIRRDHAQALEALVDAMEEGRSPARAAAALAGRFDLTERQVEVLERGAEALAREREQIRHLGALVAVGREASVIHTEDDLLGRVTAAVEAAFGADRVRVGLLRNGRLVYVRDPAPDPVLDPLRRAALANARPAGTPADGTLVLPLSVKGRGAGVLEVALPDGELSERDRSVLVSLASQLSIALENARLYQQLDGLFRSYISPDVATALLADPEQASLGGAVAEVTVLMADLDGFTPFAEKTAPTEVVAMLNAYYGEVVPCVLDAGGTVVQFVGDAVMAIFNAPVRQADHADRAAVAGLRMQSRVAAVARDGWPRFRVGINTGPALVGNIGSERMRNYTAIGDTTNLAARLQTMAPTGSVVVSAATLALLPAGARTAPLGLLPVKGRAEPVAAFVLRDY